MAFSVLRCMIWWWKHARSDALVAIQSMLSLIEFFDHEKLGWLSSNSGTLLFLELGSWNDIRHKLPKVAWTSRLVWFLMAVHRHAFFMWLALKNRLTTRVRPNKWGYTGDTTCVFYRFFFLKAVVICSSVTLYIGRVTHRQKN